MFRVFQVSSLRKSGIIVSVEKAHYQSRLTTSQQAEFLALLLSPLMEKRRQVTQPHISDPAAFPPNFCVSACPLIFDVRVFEAAMRLG